MRRVLRGFAPVRDRSGRRQISTLTKERTQVQKSKSYPTMLMVLLMALLPVVFLAGCRGNLGWDRMGSPAGRQSQSGFHQSR